MWQAPADSMTLIAPSGFRSFTNVCAAGVCDRHRLCKGLQRGRVLDRLAVRPHQLFAAPFLPLSCPPPILVIASLFQTLRRNQRHAAAHAVLAAGLQPLSVHTRGASKPDVLLAAAAPRPPTGAPPCQSPKRFAVSNPAANPAAGGATRAWSTTRTGRGRCWWTGCTALTKSATPSTFPPRASSRWARLQTCPHVWAGRCWRRGW